MVRLTNFWRTFNACLLPVLAPAPVQQHPRQLYGRFAQIATLLPASAGDAPRTTPAYGERCPVIRSQSSIHAQYRDIARTTANRSVSVVSAPNISPIHRGQYTRILISFAANHDAIHMAQVLLRSSRDLMPPLMDMVRCGKLALADRRAVIQRRRSTPIFFRLSQKAALRAWIINISHFSALTGNRIDEIIGETASCPDRQYQRGFYRHRNRDDITHVF